MCVRVIAFSIALIAVVTANCSTTGNVGPCLGGAAGDPCPGGVGTCVSDTTDPAVPIVCCTDTAAVITTTFRAPTTTRACVDLVNAATGISDCPNRVQYCNNTAYYSLMSQQCPKTCGRCTASSTTTSCVDLLNPSTGVSDCSRRASLCTNANYVSLMRVQCPKTCGFCSATSTNTTSTSSCVDLTNPTTGVTDCPSRVSLCTNAAYSSLMRTQCPKTCGYCTSSSVTTTASSVTTCVDMTNPSTGVSDCPSLSAYCTNSLYRTLMTQQCPRTCGFCTSG